MSAAQGHYTAVLTIERVSVTEARPVGRSETQTARAVSEVARVVIRAATLESLREKVAAHAALIEDGEP
ncbi:hypothetical protein SEA_OBITOO_58 [Arthrobacter phage ObiToo]|nr:hypothetical protein SEA_OBITOO_58 [Arthrobacter phage ObiToo]